MTRRTVVLVALLVSLVVNGLLIGLWAGKAMSRERGLYAMSEHILKRRPDQLSDEAQAVLRSKRGEMRAAFRQLRLARKNLDRMMVEPQVDVERARQAFAELREADQSLKRLVHEVLLEILPTLSPEQRLALMRHERGPDYRERKVPDGREPKGADERGLAPPMGPVDGHGGFPPPPPPR